MTDLKLLPWQRDAIVDAATSGEKHDALAAEFGVTRRYVGWLTQRRTGIHKPRGRPKKEVLANFMLSTSSIGTATVIG